jgi:hypothetical protein
MRDLKRISGRTTNPKNGENLQPRVPKRWLEKSGCPVPGWEGRGGFMIVYGSTLIGAR